MRLRFESFSSTCHACLSDLVSEALRARNDMKLEATLSRANLRAWVPQPGTRVVITDLRNGELAAESRDLIDLMQPVAIVAVAQSGTCSVQYDKNSAPIELRDVSLDSLVGVARMAALAAFAVAGAGRW